MAITIAPIPSLAGDGKILPRGLPVCVWEREREREREREWEGFLIRDGGGVALESSF